MIEKLVKEEIKRVPPYIPGKSIDEIARAYSLPEEKIIKLASNENPLGASPKAIEAIRTHAAKVNIYPDALAGELRDALSRYIGLPAENILVGNGSDDVMEQCAKVFLSRGDSAIITPPTFSYYQILITMYGSQCIEVPLKEGDTEYAFDAEALLNAATRAKLLFLCSPNNPTGNLIPEALLREILEKEAIVILDEAYAEFAGTSFAHLVKHHENLIVLRTFSKAFGLAGLRVGYCLASEKVIDYLARVRQPFSVNLLAQVAAMAALEDKEFLKQSVDIVREGRKYLVEELRKIPGIKAFTSQANFVLFRVEKLGLAEELLKRGIITRGCESFPGLDARYIRVSVGMPEENRRFIAALRELL
jgi:histidinol-phosphate aminotransferase